jgi:hypothetical protein
MIIQTLTIRRFDRDPCVLWVEESPVPVVTRDDEPFDPQARVGWQIDFHGDGRRVFREAASRCQKAAVPQAGTAGKLPITEMT